MCFYVYVQVKFGLTAHPSPNSAVINPDSLYFPNFPSPDALLVLLHPTGIRNLSVTSEQC